MISASGAFTKYFAGPKAGAFFLALCLAPYGCKRTADEPVLRGFTMGTNYQVRLETLPPGVSRDDLQNQIDELLNEINALLSTYDQNSEISRLNRARASTPLRLSPATARVLRAALKMNAATSGAFDPTVPPLLRLWGFGAGADVREHETRPGTAEIRAARARVGARHLRLNGDTLVKKRAGVELDFSAIAKGYAVDRVYEHLRSRGIETMMVEIGGEVRVGRGRDEGRRPWRIGLERPRYDGGREILRVAELEERAVATSGDYRIFFEIDGRRYAHIIDPRTGEPARSSVRAATVIGPDCQTADALATSLLILGRTNGLALCERYKDFECMLVMGQDVPKPGAATEGSKRRVVGQDAPGVPGEAGHSRPRAATEGGDREKFKVLLSSGMASFLSNK